MKTFLIILAGLAAWGLAVSGLAAEKRGALALQFDDGWHEWRTELAPLVKEYGGVATVFVNNKYILGGRITLDELRSLQDDFGWEIGTHTANHYNAPRYVQTKGLDAWLASELDPSLQLLRDAGLRVNALVFPFNASTPEIEQAALTRVTSFRRVNSLALADGVRPDGSLPGTPIDTTQYAPVDLMKKWIDLAHDRNTVLFLYGHRVLPDEAFPTGRVVAVSGSTVTLDRPVALEKGEENVLVPDMERRQAIKDILAVESVDGATIQLAAPAPATVKPGNLVLVGPSYGTRRADFIELLKYASHKLKFYTIADIPAGKAQEPPPAP